MLESIITVWAKRGESNVRKQNDKDSSAGRKAKYDRQTGWLGLSCTGSVCGCSRN